MESVCEVRSEGRGTRDARLRMKRSWRVSCAFCRLMSFFFLSFFSLSFSAPGSTAYDEDVEWLASCLQHRRQMSTD